MDLEKAISGGSSRNQFLHKNLIKQKQNTESPNNNYTEILDNITSRSRHVVSKKGRKAKHAYKADCKLECCYPVQSLCDDCEQLRQERERLCKDNTFTEYTPIICNHELPIASCMERPENDVTVEETVEELTSKQTSDNKQPLKSSSYIVKFLSEESMHTCSSNNLSMGTAQCEEKGGEIREIDYVEPIPDDVIRRYKLSEAEIRNIPKFNDYSPGTPNNVRKAV